MWPRIQLATLLTLILCTLPVLGRPFARQALARSDDVISGTDFLSVFIGASMPRPRNRNYNKRQGSVASEETTAFGVRTVPKDSNSLPEESLSDSSSILPDPDNSQTESEQDIVDEVSTGSTGLSTTQTDETDVLTNESKKSLLSNTPLNGVNAQHEGTESIADSSITSTKIIEYVPNYSSDKTVDFERDIEKDEITVTSTSPSNIYTSSDKSNSIAVGLADISSTFAINNTTTTEAEILSGKSTETTSDISEIPVDNKTFYTDPDSSKGDENRADWPSLRKGDEDATQNQTHKVVSVRVSSSVALGTAQQSNKIDHDNKDILDTFLDDFSHNIEKEAHGPSVEGASLVTEEQPAATAIQRSQFSVEESSPSSIIAVHQESSSSNIQSQQGAIESPLTPRSSPVSYHTSVSTATSGSRTQFYSEPPSYHRTASSVAETVQRTVVAQQPQPGSIFQSGGISSQHIHSNYQTSSPQRNFNVDAQNAGQQFQGESSRTQKSFEGHQEPPERNYELPEQNYGSPERIFAVPEENYEVDEAVSVMTNGRVHGVQFPAATTPGQQADTALREFNSQQGQSRDPNSKFGYVVEGRNFRKYQVEERTSDGFIVGEYGVVSHDDGSLRGVRYTADGTINPRLIYDALVKFLSL